MDGVVRPWYRSRLFWLGVPGLVFLVWAWGSSNFRTTLVGITGFKFGAEINSNSGAVDAEFYSYGPKSPLLFDLSIHAETLESSERCWLPPAIASVMEFDDPFEEQKTIHRVAYWTIVLAYVAFWLGVVAWWQQRKARLLGPRDSSPAAAPE